MEDQDFVRSYDSAPRPPSFPLFGQQPFSLSQSFNCVSQFELTDGIRGEVPNLTGESLVLFKPFTAL
jgi:hypothetical protein